MILTHLALRGWRANVFFQLKKRGRLLWCSLRNSEYESMSFDETLLFNSNFGHSTAELHLKKNPQTRSSSRWPASQRQVRWSVSGLLMGPNGAICPICWLMYLAVQDLGTGNTAALKSISTTAVSRGLTWTRDALQNCLSSSALETVF